MATKAKKKPAARKKAAPAPKPTPNKVYEVSWKNGSVSHEVHPDLKSVFQWLDDTGQTRNIRSVIETGEECTA